ncbi:STP22 [[Candida] subhashii]|uniref:STP22 n=1 Tax=[Candida] subhashii TaxID=561895 RepID=A0A8J5QRW1_9ASCO|nr:STP22 [[Candida] subhashii]KAG7665303.1 STP22 [[Candida] subhashii]
MDQQAPLSEQVSNWLFNVIQPQYIYKQIVYGHVYQFLQFHLKKNLNFKIRTKVYTSSETGQSDLLINLFGTIKINDEISVPIEIWIPLTYPFIDNPVDKGVPRVFIIPDHSKNWYLKPGNQVDSQGRFYHPYLSAWYRECMANNQDSLRRFNLLELINITYQTVIAEPPICSQLPAMVSPNLTGSQLPPNLTGPQLPPKPARIPTVQSPPTRISPVQAPAFPTRSPSLSTSRITPVVPQQTTGPPPLPAKPPKIQSPHHTGNGTTSNTIPLKYQAPLPLPNQGPEPGPVPIRRPSSENFQYPRDSSASPLPPIGFQGRQQPPPPPPPAPPANLQAQRPMAYEHTQGMQQYQQYQQHEQQYKHPQHYTGNSMNQAQHAPVPKPEPIDLMDAESSERQISPIDTKRQEMLQQLSIKINSFLTDPTSQSINNEVPIINEQSNKVEALYNQLSHHYQQGLRNSQNLDDHLGYLTSQLTNLTNLNRDLSKLDELNSNSRDTVSTGLQSKIKLDELVIPDSPLVKQLYETVSEIKSIKDTIALISGGFHNQSEIINDSRLEICVKTVRNLGRELFWLELTKNEIADNIMHLRQH